MGGSHHDQNFVCLLAQTLPKSLNCMISLKYYVHCLYFFLKRRVPHIKMIDAIKLGILDGEMGGIKKKHQTGRGRLETYGEKKFRSRRLYLVFLKARRYGIVDSRT